MKLALSTTLSASTPRCSTTIFFTRSATSLISSFPSCVGLAARRVDNPGRPPVGTPTAIRPSAPLLATRLEFRTGSGDADARNITRTLVRARRQTGSIAYLFHQGERADSAVQPHRR